MLDALEKMSVGQQQQFKDTANKLLATTFLHILANLDVVILFLLLVLSDL